MGWLKRFLGWLFPFYCLGCGKIDEEICSVCLGAVKFDYQLCCPYCLRVETIEEPYENVTLEGNANSDSGLTCNQCVEDVAKLDGLWAAVNYDNKQLIGKGIFEFKYKFRENLSEALGSILANLIGKLAWSLEDNGSSEKLNLVISYIPLHLSKLKSRGFNQAQLLAEMAAKQLVMKWGSTLEVRDLLIRQKYTQAQMSLKSAARKKNVEDIFVAKGEIEFPEQVILIDDVATTLATLEEAARVLKKSGVRKVYGLVLARQRLSSNKF